MARPRNKMVRTNRSRSAFVDEATRWYATALQKKRLKDDLIRGLRAMAEEDIKIITEWEPASAEFIEHKRTIA